MKITMKGSRLQKAKIFDCLHHRTCDALCGKGEGGKKLKFKNCFFLIEKLSAVSFIKHKKSWILGILQISECDLMMICSSF